MSIVANNIQEIVERSLYTQIRSKLIEMEFSVDMDGLTTTAEYTAAEQDIIADKGFAVEVYNSVPTPDKGVIKTPRIVLRTLSILPSEDTAAGGIAFIDGPNNTKTKVKYPELYSRMTMEVRTVVSSNAQDRICNAAIFHSIGRREYIPYYNDSSKIFLAINEQALLFDNVEVGIMERVYIYTITDILDYQHKIITTGISTMNQIDINPHLGLDDLSPAENNDFTISGN